MLHAQPQDVGLRSLLPAASAAAAACCLPPAAAAPAEPCLCVFLLAKPGPNVWNLLHHICRR